VFSRQVTESCATGTIIVIIMNSCNCQSCIKISRSSCLCGNLYASCDPNSADRLCETSCGSVGGSVPPDHQFLLKHLGAAGADFRQHFIPKNAAAPLPLPSQGKRHTPPPFGPVSHRSRSELEHWREVAARLSASQAEAAMPERVRSQVRRKVSLQ